MQPAPGRAEPGSSARAEKPSGFLRGLRPTTRVPSEVPRPCPAPGTPTQTLLGLLAKPPWGSPSRLCISVLVGWLMFDRLFGYRSSVEGRLRHSRDNIQDMDLKRLWIRTLFELSPSL